MTTRLAVALDADSEAGFWKQLSCFQGLSVVIKVGLSSLGWFKATDLQKLKDLGFGVFVDAKLHDIPTQVARAVRFWSDCGADYLTIHLSGGSSMIRAAVESHRNLQLLGVSVLTSLSDSDLKDWSLGDGRRQSLVPHWVKKASSDGLSGFVCSALELKHFDRDFVQQNCFCTPGLSWGTESRAKDQKATASWREALDSGSRLLVMGRSLLESEDPRGRTVEVLGAMQS
jgi:orotidine-5'-phosphate decarboxylase